MPGFPLEEVFDPTGAGDSFAGGFVGHIARADSLVPAELRRAMVYGSVLGSYACERFSVGRLERLTEPEIRERVEEFRKITSFETHVPAEEHV